jgi:retron-type reverse transcriptase
MIDIKDSKRLKNIYPLVYETENLVKSQYNAQKGKKDRPEVKEFNDNILTNLDRLYDMLESESYQPGKYRIKTIYEPKERVIMIAPFFPDRIIHHCIINVLGDVWIKTL